MYSGYATNIARTIFGRSQIPIQMLSGTLCLAIKRPEHEITSRLHVLAGLRIHGFYFHSLYELENAVHLCTVDGLVRFAAQYHVIYLLLP